MGSREGVKRVANTGGHAMADDKSSVDGASEASALHHFSEQTSAQQVASSWSLISELEHLPQQATHAQVPTPGYGNLSTVTPLTRSIPPVPPVGEPDSAPPATASSWQATLDTPTPVAHEPTPLPATACATESAPAAAYHTPPQAGGASGAPAFGQLFSGYSQPAPAPQTGEETPLKPLLHAIAQQGGA